MRLPEAAQQRHGLRKPLSAALLLPACGGMPMRHRSEFLASQEEDVWDFRHVRDQQRESSGSWHRHRIADSHDGFGGRVRLHYEHRLLHGDDHALHNLDEHEDLTHLGCEGGALRAHYAHGGSRGARLLGPHRPGRHRLTTLRVGSSWGCDAGVLPGGTPTNFFRVLGHDCLEADAGGCHHHHFRVEPAHLLDVFEDLHVDFRWRSSGGASASAGAGTGAARAGAAAASAPAARGLLGQPQAPARQLAHNLPQGDHELVLNPPMATEEEIEAACQGGVIPDSHKWWSCDGSVLQEHRRRRGHVTRYGPCVCPKGSWWGNKGSVWACWTDLCDNMVDMVVGYDTSIRTARSGTNISFRRSGRLSSRREERARGGARGVERSVQRRPKQCARTSERWFPCRFLVFCPCTAGRRPPRGAASRTS
ncbi:unnamed protein product, partial [Prorocentrum cordatum]